MLEPSKAFLGMLSKAVVFLYKPCEVDNKCKVNNFIFNIFLWPSSNVYGSLQDANTDYNHNLQEQDNHLESFWQHYRTNLQRIPVPR